ncbi:MAG: hypothetical protein ACU88J_16315 [Gammaproteobacteria bacterium]
MAISNRSDNQQAGAREHYKIAINDIEFKEKQFMEDEVQYYKTLKTKPRKQVHSDLMPRSRRRMVQKNGE